MEKRLMEIECIKIGLIQSNCYVVNGDKTQLIVDPANFTEKLKDLIDKAGDKERYILLTHRHFDHVGGVAGIKEYCSAKSVIHETDEQGLWDNDFSLASKFRAKITPTKADITVKGGELLNLGEFNVKVINTPGHTSGSVSYVIDRCIFTGDTLFCGTVGRYDFESGDYHTLINSVKTLVDLKGDYDLYPGHMDTTSLQYERENNPYIAGKIL